MSEDKKFNYELPPMPTVLNDIILEEKDEEKHKERMSLAFADQYDFVMVFPMTGENNETQSATATACIFSMIEAGLDIFPYLSIQKDELLVLIRADESKLRNFADKIDFKMRLDSTRIKEILEAGDAANEIAPVKIPDDIKFSAYGPYEHIYGKYEETLHDIYWQSEDEDTIFVASTRRKLLYNIFQAPVTDGGCGIAVSNLLLSGKILALFPLHDRASASKLLKSSLGLSIFPWSMPMLRIRNYFGEKVGLYFQFIGHYSLYLCIPAFIGFIFQLIVWGTGNYSHPVLPWFSIIISVWAVILLENWKRKESTIALEWGMTAFEDEEPDRPDYKGLTIDSFIDGSKTLYFPPAMKSVRLGASYSVIFTYISLVILCVVGIYVLRYGLQKDANANASIIASVLNSIQILVFNMMYEKLAVILTKEENHRTDTMYEDAMIIKLFSFQFINSYASFFYIAFVAALLDNVEVDSPENLGQCGAVNCMIPLSINLAVIFGTRLFVGNVTDSIVPIINKHLKTKAEHEGVEDVHLKETIAEEDYILAQVTPSDNIIAYADTCIQFGFMSMFCVALPIAPFFVLFNNNLKMKLRAWRMTKMYQRPVPQGAQDIGSWQSIFAILTTVSVMTNAGLICFTMDLTWETVANGGWGASDAQRLWMFIAFQWVVIGFQFVCGVYIDDVPDDVDIQLKRMDFINSKVIFKVADEDFGEEEVSFDAEENDSSTEFKPKEKKVCGCFTKVHLTRKLSKAVASRDQIQTGTYPKFSVNEDAWPASYNAKSMPTQ
jgi:anoctamin-10/anoctamin-7